MTIFTVSHPILTLSLLILFLCPDPNGFAAEKSDSDYFIFKDLRTAAAWYHSDYQKIANGSPELLKASDQAYNRVSKLLQDVWKGYQKAKIVASLPPLPPVPLILDTEQKYAFVGFDQESKKIPNVFFITKGMLNANTDNAVKGVIAHEIAHYVLKHPNPELKASLDKYYIASSPTEVVGSTQLHQPELKKQVDRWKTLARLLGGYHLMSLQGLPMAEPYQKPTLEKMLLKIAAHGKEQASCMSLEISLKGLRAKLSDEMNFRIFTEEMVIDESQVTSFSDLVSRVKKDLNSCLNLPGVSLGKLLKDTYEGKDFYSISNLEATDLTEEERQQLNEPAALGFTKISELLSKRKFDLEKELPLSKVRIHGAEDIANETALKVLTALDLDSSPLVDMYMSYFSKELDDRCRRMIDSGSVPAYGHISNPNHGLCYQAYSVVQYEKYLKNRR